MYFGFKLIENQLIVTHWLNSFKIRIEKFKIHQRLVVVLDYTENFADAPIFFDPLSIHLLFDVCMHNELIDFFNFGNIIYVFFNPLH